MKFKNLFVFLSFVIVINVNAQWSTNYENNLRISNWSRLPLSATSDGNGGVYIAINRDITINDTIPGSYSYLFRLDKYGYNKWSEPIHIGLEDWQHDVALIEDGSGGVIACIRDLDFIRWSDGGHWIWDYKISLQRIDSLGNKLWGDGIFVCTDTTDQYEFDICTDGNGGCYVSWLSEKTMDYIYSDGYRAIQHISASGERMWSDTGKVLYTGGVVQLDELWNKIKPNNAGGIYTINTPNLNDFYYISISVNGDILWELRSRFTNVPNEFFSNNEGGVFAFSLERGGGYEYKNFEMDRIAENGEYIWDDKKTFVDLVGDRSRIIDLYFNDDSSASIYWIDMDGSGNYVSYYQLIDKNGGLQFNGNGITPSEEYPNQNWADRMIKSDDDYIILYIDDQLKAHKLTQNGESVWTEDVVFSTMGASDRRYISDKNGGFIYTFIEGLNGLWAQQVSSNGNLGEVITNIIFNKSILPKTFKLSQNYPNPFNPRTTINYSISKSGFVQLTVYDVLGRDVAKLVNEHQKNGKYSVQFNASNLPSGVYFYKIVSGSFSKVNKMLLLR